MFTIPPIYLTPVAAAAEKAKREILIKFLFVLVAVLFFVFRKKIFGKR